ncbi:MAG TPA: hypothetical protein VG186_15970 [Solirubrobacteraceae bacterium]|nr:hypothetical protein [Solirubrobacteraceae bacterium]
MAGAAGQTLLSDTFDQATTLAPVTTLAGASTPAPLPCLTAGTTTGPSTIPGCNLPTPDAPGAGVLRLTNAAGVLNGESGGVLYGASFPVSAGLEVKFKQYQWGGAGGGDGLSFDLAVAPPQPTAIGSAGAGLGYAATTPIYGGAPGFPAGWLGFGLDEYGNYTNPAENEPACTEAAWQMQNLEQSQLVVRGPGNAMTGYCPLASSLQSAQDPIGTRVNQVLLRGPNRASSLRSVDIKIDPVGHTFTVGMDTAGGTTYQTIASGSLPSAYLDASGTAHAGLPPRLTFAFAGSTGAATDVHEVSDVSVTTLNGSVPQLSLTKTDNVNGAPTAGGPLTYTLTAGVAATSPLGELQSTPVTITDPLPTGETTSAAPSGTGWDCSASTSTHVSCTRNLAALPAAGSTLPPVSVPVTAPLSVVGPVTNTATVVSYDGAPGSASDTVTFPRPALTLSKTDDVGGQATPGGPVTYTLTAGVAATSPASETRAKTVLITDPLPAAETTTATPSGTGWDCTASTATNVSCTNTSASSIAAGASLPPVTVTVPVTVAASAVGPIANTAQVGSTDALAPVSATDTVTAPQPALTLTKADNVAGKATAGGTVTYTLTAGLAATSPVAEGKPTTIIVTDPLPGSETSSATPSGTGWDCSASTATRVSCTNTTPGAVAAGATLAHISVPVTISASALGQIANTAKVESADTAAAVSATDTVTVPQPVLALTHTDSGHGTAYPGGALTYTLTAGVAASTPVAEAKPATMAIDDPLASGETTSAMPSGTGWNCSASTATHVRCTSEATTTVAAGATLPPVSIPVTIGASTAGMLTDTAVLNSADALAPVSAADTVTVPATGIAGLVPTAAPVNIVAPTVSGAPRPGRTLTCGPGTWTGNPTRYLYAWRRGAGLVAGATAATYVVGIADEAQTLTCVVVAINSAGYGTAASPGALVALPGTLGCPKPSGSLGAGRLGPFSLQSSRATVRKINPRYLVTRNGFDNFCLYAGWGIRLGYPSHQLLHSLSASVRSKVTGRVVTALTANPYYRLDRVSPGTVLTAAVMRRMHLGSRIAAGTNDWYLAPGSGGAEGILKVRRAIVQEVGLANTVLNHGRAAQRRFITSFRAG